METRDRETGQALATLTSALIVLICIWAGVSTQLVIAANDFDSAALNCGTVSSQPSTAFMAASVIVLCLAGVAALVTALRYVTRRATWKPFVAAISAWAVLLFIWYLSDGFDQALCRMVGA